MTINFLESPDKLFNFYDEKLKYYAYWSKHHKINYWLLLWVSLVTGISLAGAMIFQVPAKYITMIALILNGLLIIGKAIGSDDKYIRYRTTEIQLQFLLQSMKTDITSLVQSGQSQEEALLQTIKEYHPKIESIVKLEFDDHFSKQKSIESIHSLVSSNTIVKKTNRDRTPHH